jgi:hypothetical protein
MEENKTTEMTRMPAHNRRLAQWRVQWLIERSTSHQLLWCIDSSVLRNPPLRQAPNRSNQLFLFTTRMVNIMLGKLDYLND